MGEGRFRARVALITGGGHGIGRATALAFAREGAAVAVLERDPGRCRQVEAELAALGRPGLGLVVDVGDAEAYGRAIDDVAATLGRLDAVVNNAAGPGWAPVRAVTLEQWEACLNVSARAALISAQRATPHMVRSGGGAIVNISSAHGLVSGPSFTAHAAAKAAVLGLTRQLATELGPLGIRVNAIAPGAIMTGAALPEEIERLALQCYAVGRLGRPEDVAAGVLYLCSDDAAFVTGVTLPIDGGLTALNAEHVAYKPALDAQREERHRWGGAGT
jgi:NAD(P)-dependent dehydrogenase (short-subunit alcohol dehydrogenase family)